MPPHKEKAPRKRVPFLCGRGDRTAHVPIRSQSAVRFVGRNALAAKHRHAKAHGVLPLAPPSAAQFLAATHKQKGKLVLCWRHSRMEFNA